MGSEMCIRDSCKCAGGGSSPGAGRRNREFVFPHQAGWNQLCDGSSGGRSLLQGSRGEHRLRPEDSGAGDGGVDEQSGPPGQYFKSQLHGHRSGTLSEQPGRELLDPAVCPLTLRETVNLCLCLKDAQLQGNLQTEIRKNYI